MVDTLRERPSLTAAGIATALLTHRGVPADEAIAGDLKKRVLLLLRAMRKQGNVPREARSGRSRNARSRKADLRRAVRFFVDGSGT